MATVPQGALLTMLGIEFSCSLELPATGASGGILIAWKRSIGMTDGRRVDTHSALV
jgi:hypothetical protein